MPCWLVRIVLARPALATACRLALSCTLRTACAVSAGVAAGVVAAPPDKIVWGAFGFLSAPATPTAALAALATAPIVAALAASHEPAAMIGAATAI